jgi:hypothetical protein
VSQRSRVLQEVSEQEAEVEAEPNYSTSQKQSRDTPRAWKGRREVTRRWTSETRSGSSRSQTDEATRKRSTSRVDERAAAKQSRRRVKVRAAGGCRGSRDLIAHVRGGLTGLGDRVAASNTCESATDTGERWR